MHSLRIEVIRNRASKIHGSTLANVHPHSPSSSIMAHYNRQRLKHDLVPLKMTDIAPLQHPLQPLQPCQLPSLVNPHDTRIVYPHHQPRSVPLPCIIADGVLIPAIKFWWNQPILICVDVCEHLETFSLVDVAHVQVFDD